MLLHELILLVLPESLWLAPALANQAAPPLTELLPGLLPLLFGILSGKAGQNLWRGILEITEEIDRLVIAHQDDDFASLFRCLALQTHEEIHYLPDARATVDEVTGLDQGGVATAPVAIDVDQAGFAQNTLDTLDLAMHITDRDHSTCGV
jgi:hypothetical protein